MNNCPNGFFCFQKSIFILLCIILLIINYIIIKKYINSNNDNDIRYKRINDPLYPPEKTYNPHFK